MRRSSSRHKIAVRVGDKTLGATAGGGPAQGGQGGRPFDPDFNI